MIYDNYIFYLNEKLKQGTNNEEFILQEIFNHHIELILLKIEDIEFLGTLFLNELVFLHLNELYLNMLMSFSSIKLRLSIIKFHFLILAVYFLYVKQIKLKFLYLEIFENFSEFLCKSLLNLLFIIGDEYKEEYFEENEKEKECSYDESPIDLNSLDIKTSLKNQADDIKKLIVKVGKEKLSSKELNFSEESESAITVLSIFQSISTKTSVIVSNSRLKLYFLSFRKNINFNEKENKYLLELTRLLNELEKKLFKVYNESTEEDYNKIFNLPENTINNINNPDIEKKVNISDILVKNLFLNEIIYDFVSNNHSFKIMNFPDYIFENLAEVISFIYTKSKKSKMIKETLIEHLKYNTNNKTLLYFLLQYYFKKSNYSKCKLIIKIILSEYDETLNVVDDIKSQIGIQVNEIKLIDQKPRNNQLMNHNSHILNYTFLIHILILIEQDRLSKSLEHAIVNLERIKLASKLNIHYRNSNENFLKRSFYLLGICYTKIGIEALSQTEREIVFNSALNCYEKCFVDSFLNELADTDEFFNKYQKQLYSVYFFMYIRQLYEQQDYNKSFFLINLIRTETREDSCKFQYDMSNFLVLKCFLLIAIKSFNKANSLATTALKELKEIKTLDKSDPDEFPMENYIMLVKILNYLFVIEEKSNLSYGIIHNKEKEKVIEFIAKNIKELDQDLANIISYYKNQIEKINEIKKKGKEIDMSLSQMTYKFNKYKKLFNQTVKDFALINEMLDQNIPCYQPIKSTIEPFLVKVDDEENYDDCSLILMVIFLNRKLFNLNTFK